MSVKIWQVPNKSKAMAQVFARKSGAHIKQRSRVIEREQWLREAEEELKEVANERLSSSGSN
jgi:hypothetical protein